MLRSAPQVGVPPVCEGEAEAQTGRLGGLGCLRVALRRLRLGHRTPSAAVPEPRRLDNGRLDAYVFGAVFRQDFIKRQIEMFGQALAGMAGKRQEGHPEEALVEAREAYVMLGIDPSYLRLDTRSLVSLVGRGPRLTALCDLLEEQALSHEALGDGSAAAQCRARASELRALPGS